MKICPKCKSEQKDTSKFCSECGTNLEEVKVEETKENSIANTHDGTAINIDDYKGLYYGNEEVYINNIVSC